MLSISADFDGGQWRDEFAHWPSNWIGRVGHFSHLSDLFHLVADRFLSLFLVASYVVDGLSTGDTLGPFDLCWLARIHQQRRRRNSFSCPISSPCACNCLSPFLRGLPPSFIGRRPPFFFPQSVGPLHRQRQSTQSIVNLLRGPISVFPLDV